jgi:pyridoxal phosphate enzyme (YggS family)
MITTDYQYIRSNFESISERIKRAANRSGRDAHEIRLIAVSKKQSAEKILYAREIGIVNFGENYPEETLKKIDQLKNEADSISWHMIGHLQSRKAKIVAAQFSYIHSIDNLHVVQELSSELEKSNIAINGLIEVNLTGETSKTGFPAWSQEYFTKTIDSIRSIISFQRIKLTGLMTMPPLSDNPEDSRPIYQKLRNLQTQLSNTFPDQQWNILSMGTSFDFEVAIEEGASMVRIGEAIFGPR